MLRLSAIAFSLAFYGHDNKTPLSENRGLSSIVGHFGVSSDSGRVSWEHLDTRIRDVFIDTLYQRNPTAREFVIAAAHNNRSEVIKYIQNDPTCRSYEHHRRRIPYLS